MNTEVSPLEFPTVDPDDQQVVEMQFTESANKASWQALTAAGVEMPSSKRSAGSKKAWETRRKRKAAGLPQSIITGGISAEDAQQLRTLPSRIYEQRELVAESQDRLEEMEQEWDALITRITVKP